MMRTRLHRLIPLLLMAQAATAQTEPAMDAKGWNLDTAPKSQTETPAEPPSTLNMRVYKDFDGHRPQRGDTPYAVDVSAVMTRCSDGSLIVTALVIGGQLTPLDNRCPTSSK
ncbi:MAG: hypothetical protein FJ170_03630 [Gammaproteobacteria bacterium]|nr:hypothetical protein [Gammaproteobacteria bacterium]